MRNHCQFCDKSPGYLQKFARAWACYNCLFEYGLLDHPQLSAEVDIDDGWEDRQQHYNKSLKSKVTIEELECDPNDLASATHYVRTLADAKKVEVKASKWTVEFL